ncbi:MAG: hypothetical protein ACYC8T_27175, partial [Myxococcaceae bacterium]
LVHSDRATNDDRYTLARLQLSRSPRDPHPRARQRDPALVDLERLADDGFPLAKALEKDKAVSDEERYYVGFHFSEQPSPDTRSVGAALLESIALKGRGKLAKAARNKLELRRI